MSATVHDQFVGVADESTYAVPQAVDTFYEHTSESVTGSYERIEAEGIRGDTLREDRWVPNPKGAGGDLETEVKDKGFDFWLKYILGDVDSTTTPGTFTATPGSLAGKSFTYQAGRYSPGSDTLIPFTYSGCKVTEWELSAEVDGILKFKATIDAASETIDEDESIPASALAVPTYPADSQLLTFIGASCTVGGNAFPVSSISITGNLGLKVDRYAMRGANSTTKREPKEQDMKAWGFTLSAEFEDKSMSDRVAAAAAAGAMAEIVLHFDSPQGGTLDVTGLKGRFDEGPVAAAREVTTQELTGKFVKPTTGDALEVVYVPAT